MKTKLIFGAFSFLLLFSMCKKAPKEEIDVFDLNETGAFRYMPMYFGSFWNYSIYDKLDNNKLVEKEFTRYDSIRTYLFTYNDTGALKSWAMWTFSGDKTELRAGVNLVLTSQYLHLSNDSMIVLLENNNSVTYIYGGATYIDTKFGVVPCIVTMGKGKGANHYLWKRYFAESIGIVRYDDYEIRNTTDTVFADIKLLDTFYINRTFD